MQQQNNRAGASVTNKQFQSVRVDRRFRKAFKHLPQYANRQAERNRIKNDLPTASLHPTDETPTGLTHR